jgi:hypothetical protein
MCVNKSQFVPVIFEPPCIIYKVMQKKMAMTVQRFVLDTMLFCVRTNSIVPNFPEIFFQIIPRNKKNDVINFNRLAKIASDTCPTVG